MGAIHPTAIISEQAVLGEEVRVGPYSVVGDDVCLGDGCEIGPHVVIHPYTTLGRKCRVHAGAVLGDIPQDLAFQGVPSRTRIGDECVIREGVTVHRGTQADTETVVGDGCYLMAYSHLGHNVKLGNRVIVVNAALLAGYVEVDDGAFISGTVVIHQFVKIGRLAMLGGQAGIGKDIPPYCVAESSTRNRVAGLNVVGLKRAGFKPDERKQIKRAFDVIYRSNLGVREARERLAAEFPEGPASEFWKFMDRSSRGLCGFVRDNAREA